MFSCLWLPYIIVSPLLWLKLHVSLVNLSLTVNAFAPQTFDTRPKRLPLDSKERSPISRKCDGNAFLLSQRRVHVMMKTVESIDRALMLLKTLPNL